MPRFFFHVIDGRTLVDNSGVELPDVAAARNEAIRSAGAILASEGQDNWQAGPWQMVVADENAITVLSLNIQINTHGH